MSKQPTNVQAQREEGEEEGNPILSLLDEEGIFLQVELEPELERESPDHVAHTVDKLETEATPRGRSRNPETNHWNSWRSSELSGTGRKQSKRETRLRGPADGTGEGTACPK